MPPDILKILIELLKNPNSPLTLLMAGRGLSEFLKDIKKFQPPGIRVEGANQPGVSVAPSAQGASVPPGAAAQLGLGPQMDLLSQFAQGQPRQGQGSVGGGRLQ